MMAEVRFIGSGLRRPECVLATANGEFFVSHFGHGVCRIASDGSQALLAPYTECDDQPLVPNGIALLPDGSFLIANIGDSGGVYHLDDGGLLPFLVEINGRAAPPVNFVTNDRDGRIWFSVSSTLSPRHLAYRHDVADGFVAVIEDGKARIVAEGLHYANELRIDLDEGWLYVSETFGRKVSRFPITASLQTGERQTYARFPPGAFVDGIALDGEKGLWAACIVSNEIFHVPEAGADPIQVLHERDDDWVAEVEAELDAKTMGRRHFDTSPTTRLRNITSIAFHGPALNKIACGSLLSESLVDIDAPVAGLEPVHWHVEVPHWPSSIPFQDTQMRGVK